MDPNATLARIREILNEEDSGIDVVDELIELSQLVSGLDGWISAGGFLPEAWIGS